MRPSPFPPRRRLAGSVSMTRRIVGAVLAGVVLYLLYLVQTEKIAWYEITSESMSPTLQVGERYVMMQPEAYEVDDIIVFREAGMGKRRVTKRIVAKGPARVELRWGQIYVEGRRHDPPQGPGRPVPLPNRVWSLSPGEYFVVGDNRQGSLDSRDYGPIEQSRIVGRLLVEQGASRR